MATFSAARWQLCGGNIWCGSVATSRGGNVSAVSSSSPRRRRCRVVVASSSLCRRVVVVVVVASSPRRPLYRYPDGSGVTRLGHLGAAASPHRPPFVAGSSSPRCRRVVVAAPQEKKTRSWPLFGALAKEACSTWPTCELRGRLVRGTWSKERARAPVPETPEGT